MASVYQRKIREISVYNPVESGYMRDSTPANANIPEYVPTPGTELWDSNIDRAISLEERRIFDLDVEYAETLKRIADMGSE